MKPCYKQTSPISRPPRPRAEGRLVRGGFGEAGHTNLFRFAGGFFRATPKRLFGACSDGVRFDVEARQQQREMHSPVVVEAPPGGDW
jgi:hypothetical protein